MTASPNCKPWCDDHQTDSEDNSCCTRFVIYDDGRQEATPPAMAQRLEALGGGGLPPEISWVALSASQDEEDAQPLLRFQFYDAGDDPQESANLYMNLDGLRAFHSSLGAMLKGLSQPS
ncbi:hypothetical protein [Arthrobacter sp. zg-Y877]|uniref:hypothetical protein n=1 Tax=Arthrobacter sp. zg-Y877 TaxID=3049074 RepID=UPI0025A360D1|nr:hypothetical protein [Arthrobacter sp. zg-Y877]MDM7989928.1 hypothetical protein [Arthrobacter sp. zg-Y877]